MTRAPDSAIFLSNLPPTPQQRRLTLTVVLFLLLSYGAIVPFFAVEVSQPSGFIEIVLTAILTSNFLTAGLLLSQCAILRSSGLLVLGNSYLFSSLLMIPYLLTFPGIFTQKQILGSSIEAAPFLYVWWHAGFLLGVASYAMLKNVPLKSVHLFFSFGILMTVGVITILVWVIVHYGETLPSLLDNDFRLTSIGRSVAKVELAFALFAFAILWTNRSSALDYLLAVVLWLIILELSTIAFFYIERNSLGVTFSRAYFAIAAIVMLAAILAESTRLYAAVARANLMLHQERDNRLMNLQAMAASIAHEVRQPLAAIVTNGSAALRFLAKTPPDLTEVRAALNRIIDDGHRTSDVFDGIRALFGKASQERQAIAINDIVRVAFENLRAQLQANKVELHSDLADKLPIINGNRAQLQEAILNLLHNAIEAMAAVTDRDRTLRVKSGISGRGAITLEIHDSGPGISQETLRTIFDAFVTTKSHGMGLGLAICRMIAEDHGGSVSATNGVHGAVFKLTLPVSSSEQAAAKGRALTLAR